MMRAMGAERFPEAQFRAGEEWAGAIGAYDAAAYARATRAPAMIADLVRHFRARGASVVVVATPEHSRLRGREPAGVVIALAERLRAIARAPDLRVIDLRAVVADDGFVDLSHLNARGSRAFSARLAIEIGTVDRARPPLMASAVL